MLSLLLLALIFCTGCEKSIRFAEFDCGLTRDKGGALLLDLSYPNDLQAKNVAETIQRMNPDVLLLSGFDYDRLDRAQYLFEKNYLSVSQNGAPGLKYPYHFTGPVNAGVPSGYDLDRDGKAIITPGTTTYANDAIGYGLYPGAGGMLILSKFPINTLQVRTFQRLKWRQMPNALKIVDSHGNPWFPDEVMRMLRLSSRGHWDVPIQIDKKKTVHLLVSNPSSPVTEGPQDRNGKRNHDEIRMWADYINGGANSKYITDDTNAAGRDGDDFMFVVLGDEEVDPMDGPGIAGAMDQLLNNPNVNATYVPSSTGGAEAAAIAPSKNASHRTAALYDTVDYAKTARNPGNLRTDYVLPSKQIKIVGGAVFWPTTGDPLYRLVDLTPPPTTQPSTDPSSQPSTTQATSMPASQPTTQATTQPIYPNSPHRMVYVDVKF